MKITFIAASLGDGGAERVVSELATEMWDQGHEVSIIVVGSSRRSYEIAQEITVIDCAKKYPVPGLGFLKRVADIKKAVRSLGAEVCISFNTTVNVYAALACGGLSCKLILSERNDPRYYPAGKGQRALRKLLYGRADGYVFQTREAQSWFSRKIQSRSTIIFNPVNRSLPEPFRGTRTKRVVTAARLEPQKNLKMAIDAFLLLQRDHPDYIFEIYGKGSLRGELEAYIASRGAEDRVILKGNSDTLYGDILDAQMFVLSSDFEGMSNSMLEAMALGIPTISTDYPSGGARAVIEDGVNGLLVPVGDGQALYQAMKRVVEAPELARKLGENGAKLRQELSVQTITDQWMRFIEG